MLPPRVLEGEPDYYSRFGFVPGKQKQSRFTTCRTRRG